jgi:hypothetical protein
LFDPRIGGKLFFLFHVVFDSNISTVHLQLQWVLDGRAAVWLLTHFLNTSQRIHPQVFIQAMSACVGLKKPQWAAWIFNQYLKHEQVRQFEECANV